MCGKLETERDMFEKKGKRVLFGTVKGGVVIFDGSLRPPEGAVVRVEVSDTRDENDLTVGQRMLKHAGAVVADYPADSSLNVDHYLFGHPKK